MATFPCVPHGLYQHTRSGMPGLDISSPIKLKRFAERGIRIPGQDRDAGIELPD